MARILARRHISSVDSAGSAAMPSTSRSSQVPPRSTNRPRRSTCSWTTPSWWAGWHNKGWMPPACAPDTAVRPSAPPPASGRRRPMPSAGHHFRRRGTGCLISVGRAGARGAGPLKMGVALVHVLTGLDAAIAAQAALDERALACRPAHRHGFARCAGGGVGQAARQPSQGGRVLPQPRAAAHPAIVPCQDFPTSAGDALLAIRGEGAVRARFQLAAHPEWPLEQRFSTKRNKSALPLR